MNAARLTRRPRSSASGSWSRSCTRTRRRKTLTPVLGDNPKGYQIATPDGRWLALATPSARSMPEDRRGARAGVRHLDRLFRPLPDRGQHDHHQGRGGLERNHGSAANRCGTSGSRTTSCSSKARRCRIRTSTTGWCASSSSGSATNSFSSGSIRPSGSIDRPCARAGTASSCPRCRTEIGQGRARQTCRSGTGWIFHRSSGAARLRSQHMPGLSEWWRARWSSAFWLCRRLMLRQ